MEQAGEAGSPEGGLNPLAALPPDLVGLRVLVVDDDPLCTMIVAKMLRRCAPRTPSRARERG
jgi:hypothetical protein